VDGLFTIDIFISFFSAYLEEDGHQVVDDIKLIAKNYVTGWFLIDVISIFPFDLITSNSGGDNNDINGMAKITRIGRIAKFVKLTKLLRILKILKAKSKLF
jgi:DNA polymerase III gamma/tau subunit